MTMWFYDDAPDLDEYRAIREEARAVEKDYREVRAVLKEAEEALEADPGDPTLQARVKYYRKRLKDLEDNRWLASDVPLEMALWAPPHG